MPTLEVNVDSFAYHGPAPREGAERPLLFATRGQVVELDDDEAARARALLVGQVYADPTGGTTVPRRLEPAAIDAGARAAASDDLTEFNNRRRQLLDELARLDASAPLGGPVAAGATAQSTITAPALPPSITGVRNLPPMTATGDVSAEVATTGATPPSIDVAGATAEQVVAYLGQYPEQVDAVEAAEQERKGGPRKTVTEVAATIRRTAEERGADS